MDDASWLKWRAFKIANCCGYTIVLERFEILRDLGVQKWLFAKNDNRHTMSQIDISLV